MNNDLSYFSKDCRALVIGSSGAIGSALVELIKEILGAKRIVAISRTSDGFDFFNPNSIELIAKRQIGEFRLIIDATGALETKGVGPEKRLADIDYDNMLNQFTTNAIGPALIIKHFHNFLPYSGKSVFVSLSARVGSISDNQLGGWISYRSSKAALNQIIKTAAIEISRKRPEAICISLHPGTVRSSLTEKYIDKYPHFLPNDSAVKILNVINSLDTTANGGFFDYAGKIIEW